MFVSITIHNIKLKKWQRAYCIYLYVISLWFFFLHGIPKLFLLLSPFYLENFLYRNIHILGCICWENALFDFFHLRISRFPLHSWRIFLVNTEFWVDRLFIQSLKKIFCHFLLASMVFDETIHWHSNCLSCIDLVFYECFFS